MNSARQTRALVAFALLVALSLGCASSKLQGKRSFVTEAKMDRPARILIYDFRSNLEKVDPDKRRSQREYLDDAREALGAQLVKRFRNMGLMAEHVGRDVKPKPDDLVVDGEFTAIDEGNRFTRNVIGFGIGSTEMVAQVQVLRGRAGIKGMQLVFDYRAVSKGSKKPGILLPVAAGSAAVTVISGGVGVVSEVKGPVAQDAIRMANSIADELGPFFVEQGWVPQEAIED